MDPIEEFIELSKRKKELTRELEEVKSTLGALDAIILERFTQDGTEKITRNGMTLYVHSQLWAKKKEGISNAQAVRALEEAGYEDYTTLNHQSLSALLREWEKAREPIPEGLQNFIEGSTAYSIRARKA
jgi:hypothetical protein